jgi:hypothetical protein
MVVKPRFWPRNAEDAAIALAVGLLQVTVLFFFPSIVVAFATWIAAGSCGLGLVAFAVAFGSLYSIWLAFTVTSLRLDEKGLRFRRLLGSPKILTWDQITSVAPATRQELIVKGWLWPPFPAREMTPSLTSLGHYRVTWRNGFCYYPPADPASFEEALRPYCGGVA